MSEDHAENRLNLISSLALLVVVVMTLAMAFVSTEFAPLSGKAAVFYAALVLYTVAGVWGDRWNRGRRSAVTDSVYFAAQLIFFAALVQGRMPHAAIWLLTMPVISQAVSRVGLRGAAVVAVGFLVIYCLPPERPQWDAADRWRTALSLASGYVFVGVVTRTMESARVARRRAETLSAELAAANEQLRASATQAAALAAATERNRIARDIHDGLGHYLTVVAVQLQAARALLPAQPERAAEAIVKAERSAAAALADVRRSVGALREPEIPVALAAAVEGLVRESGLPAARFECLGTPRPLGEGTEKALFRVAQEALTNVRKHAGPVDVTATLDFRQPTTVVLAVADDGRGGAGETAGGFGLAGLRERLGAVGGSLEAGPRAEGGFLVRAEVRA